MMRPKRLLSPLLHTLHRPWPGVWVSWRSLARCVTLMGAVGTYGQEAFANSSCSPDGEPPVLTCPAAITVQCVYSGQDIVTDHGAVHFSDNCGLNSVNMQPHYIGALGSFTGWISAVDLSGNSTSCSTRWTIVDTSPPDLSVFGPNPVILPVGAAYVDPGARLTEDSCDGYYMSTGLLTPSGSVNTGAPGLYTVRYTGSDRAGNSASATRQVKVIPFQASMTPASNTPQIRMLHTSTRLGNGRVLVTGGFTSATEEFDPSSGNWSAVGSSLTTHRGHTATVLGNGKVLVTGGASAASEELYDPGLKTWSPVSPMSTPRYNHAAAMLPNGQVLVTGGGTSEGSGAVLASTEVYNPYTNVWSPGPTLQTARRGHTMTQLKDGRLLITGGVDANGVNLSSVEIYNYSSYEGWRTVAGMSTGRSLHTATLLESGKVMVVGGSTQAWTQGSSVEVFDPSSATWTAQGSLSHPRQEHTATALIGDMVLVTGGFNYQSGILAASEVYSPRTGTWSSVASLGVGRYKHTATSLDAYTVLLVGGANATNQSAVELFKVNSQ